MDRDLSNGLRYPPFEQLESRRYLGQASYAHAPLSPVERAMAHFLCDPGSINAMISRQKIDFVT